MEGWIKLHRKFDDWKWINKPEMVSIFIHCLVRANHNGNYWLDTEIKRGQFISRMIFSNDCKPLVLVHNLEC